jgi:hypothetical protein
MARLVRAIQLKWCIPVAEEALCHLDGPDFRAMTIAFR